MADVLRNMLVSIDFSDIDTRRLLGIDRTMTDIQNRLGGIGGQLGTVGNNFNSMGRRARQGLTPAQREAERLRREAEKLKREVEEVGRQFGEMGQAAKRGAAVVSVAMGGVVGVVGTMWTETDDVWAKLEARTGSTGQTLESLKGTVREVFKDGFGESLEEVSRDVTKVNTLFKDLSDSQLVKVSKGMYTISKLWDQDMNTINRATKNMVDNFDNLSEMDALNLMQKSFQLTGDYSDDLLDTFNEYSGYFADMGFSARQFANILVKGADAGAWNMDKVGDSVKEFGNLAREYGGNATAAFETMGMDAKKMAQQVALGGDTAQDAFVATVAGLSAMKDPVKQQAAGVALFGTMWEDLRGSVILSMSDSRDAIGYYGDAIEKASDTMQDSIKTKMLQNLRDLKLSLVETFENSKAPEMLDDLIVKSKDLIPPLVGIATAALGVANTIIDNWGSITNVLVPLAAGLGTVYVAFKAMTIVGMINTLITAYRAGTLLATASTLGLNVALLASPIGWFALGLGAVVAAGVLVYKNFDTIKEKATKLFDYIKSFSVPEWLKTLGGGISSAFTGVKNLVMGSHATGLDYVPFDGYTAELHKGESVLTAAQSDMLRGFGMLQSNGNKPTLDMAKAPAQMAPSGGGSTKIQMPTQVSINVTQNQGEDSASFARRVEDMVNTKLEELFRVLNLQIN